MKKYRRHYDQEFKTFHHLEDWISKIMHWKEISKEKFDRLAAESVVLDDLED